MKFFKMNNMNKEKAMKTVYAFCLAMFLLAGCFKSTNTAANRFPEPLRSQMMIQTLMGGVPITVALCWEEKLIAQGIDNPAKISRDAYQKAAKQCEAELKDRLKKEIEEAMAAEEAAGAI
jgi:hypothetical protein